MGRAQTPTSEWELGTGDRGTWLGALHAERLLASATTSLPQPTRGRAPASSPRPRRCGQGWGGRAPASVQLAEGSPHGFLNDIRLAGTTPPLPHHIFNYSFSIS